MRSMLCPVSHFAGADVEFCAVSTTRSIARRRPSVFTGGLTTSQQPT